MIPNSYREYHLLPTKYRVCPVATVTVECNFPVLIQPNTLGYIEMRKSGLEELGLLGGFQAFRVFGEVIRWSVPAALLKYPSIWAPVDLPVFPHK
jgi:hypothetical protein